MLATIVFFWGYAQLSLTQASKIGGNIISKKQAKNFFDAKF
jgi:hypothetical protein